MNSIIIKPYKAGEASYVSYLQMKFYEQAYGFKPIFEHYVLTSMAEFTGSSKGSQLWVALDNDEIVGSIAIMRTGEHTAQLRWFLTNTDYQGKGIGKKLMDTAMQFCREQEYTHVFLWTIQMLDAARHLYEKYGFKLTEKKPNAEWTGELLTEERWDLLLGAKPQ